MAASESLTCSSLNGFMIASIFFIPSSLREVDVHLRREGRLAAGGLPGVDVVPDYHRDVLAEGPGRAEVDRAVRVVGALVVHRQPKPVVYLAHRAVPRGQHAVIVRVSMLVLEVYVPAVAPVPSRR